MVERLKAAIEKARERREAQGLPGLSGGAAGGVPAPARSPRAAAPARGANWSALSEVRVDPERLSRERVVAYRRQEPASIAFDVLRTRLLKVCADRGWSRIGITSPSKGCGKTVVTANLALSLSRLPEVRAAAVDLDLRFPSLARCLGVKTDRRIADFLSGRVAPAAHFERFGEALALGLNASRESGSAELLQNAEATGALARMMTELRPTVALYDLPPLLVSDDVLSVLPSLDGVLLIAAAGQTLAPQIEDCERLLADNVNLIGVVLNKVADDPDIYHYDDYVM